MKDKDFIIPKLELTGSALCFLALNPKLTVANINLKAISNIIGLSKQLQATTSSISSFRHQLYAVNSCAFKSMDLSNKLLEIAAVSKIKLPVLPRIIIPNYNELFRPFEAIKKIEEEALGYTDTVNLLGKYNYLIPLNISYRDFLVFRKMLKIRNRNKTLQIIESFFLKAFAQNKWEYLEYIVQELKTNPYIKQERIDILFDCLKTIRRMSRKTSANVVLPAIIAQIDGFWLDVLENPRTRRNEIKDFDTTEYHQVACNILNEILFEQTNYKKAKEQNFCRNKILHGASLKYGSIQNVIKAFLIIEFLNSIKRNDDEKVS